MQDCFRKHPEVYGDELADDEEDTAEGEAGAAAPARTAAKDADGAAPERATAPTTSSSVPADDLPETSTPKNAYDATSANSAPPSEDELKKPAPEEKKAQEEKR
jgi:mitochondrial intermembrane space import and assembly protein 40